MENKRLMVEVFGMGMANPNERFINRKINDIPVMITKTGKLLCIPIVDETRHIGITGKSGSGKSLLENTIMGFEHWISGIPMIQINDMQQETFEQSIPCFNPIFMAIQKRINMIQFGLPMVYVYPSTKTTRIEEKSLPFIKMSIPLREIIDKLEYFYKLEGTRKYYMSRIEDFAECNTQQEILELVDEILPMTEKNARMMNIKLKAIFKEIFQDNILNITSPDAPDTLEAHFKENSNDVIYTNYTLLTLMRIGLIPSLQTYDIRNYDFFSAFICFIIDSIYTEKYDDEAFFKNTKISMYAGEIDKLFKGNNGELVKKSLGLVGTNGRMAKIGLRWNTQDYEAVPSTIRDNTKYLFCFSKSNSKEVKVIEKDFSIPSYLLDEILKLKSEPKEGLFECVALTTENFVLYNMETGEKEYTREAQIGQIIPPMAHHRIPNRRWDEK